MVLLPLFEGEVDAHPLVATTMAEDKRKEMTSELGSPRLRYAFMMCPLERWALTKSHQGQNQGKRRRASFVIISTTIKSPMNPPTSFTPARPEAFLKPW